MDLLRTVREYMRQHHMAEPGELVLVAVSGGTDSVVLLHLLHNLAQELHISLHVAHLNHMFRGAEAETDASFVADLAQEYGLPATIESIDVPAYRRAAGISAQAAARDLRYRFLRKTAKQNGVGKIALAHQADDQAETILINFLRGAGTGGLKGIVPVRENFFIRPLLPVRRAQIEEYCRINGLPFRVDSSNMKTIYLRNRIRMELLPLLVERYNPGLVEALFRQGEICRADDACLEEQGLAAYRSAKLELNGGGLGIFLNDLRRMPRAISRRALRLLWRDLTGSERDLSFTHIEDILDLPACATGSRLSLPKGVTVELSYTALEFRLQIQVPEKDSYRYLLEIPGETYIQETKSTIRAALVKPENTPAPSSLPPNEALLDFDKLPSQMLVRGRLPGDIFHPYGQRLPMKLKDFLINQKVPRALRDKLPLVCTPEDIVWVPGLRVGEKWKVGPGTKTIVHLHNY